MARLPSIQRRGELTSAPQRMASADVIATPYRAVAQAVGAGGEKLQQMATAKAGVEGANAVVQDENGNYSVQWQSPLTQFGQNYNRAAAQSLMTRQAAGFREAAANIARESNGDIAAFNRAWGEFTELRVNAADEIVRGATGDMLTEIGTTHRLGIQSAAHTRSMSIFQDDVVAERQRLAAQITSLAAAGGSASPEFASLTAQYRDLGLELAENPAYQISTEAMQWADDQFEAGLVIEQVRHDVRARFATNPAAAQAYAEEILNNPALPLTAQQRREGINAAVAEVATLTAEERAARDAYREATAPVLETLKTSQLPINTEAVEQAIAQGLAIGDYARVAELQHWARVRGSLIGFEGADNQPELYNMQFWAATGEPARLLAERGPGLDAANLNPYFGTQLARAVADWERLNPGQQAEFSSFARSTERQAQIYADYLNTQGIADHYVHNGVRYDADPDHHVSLAAPPGSSRHESGTAADVAPGPFLDWLHENAGTYSLEFLTGDAFARDPVHVQLAGEPIDFVVNNDILTEEREIMQGELTGMLGQADFLAERGIGLDGNTAQTIVDYALAVDDPALTRRAETAFLRAMTMEATGGLNREQTEAFIAQLRNPEATGDAYLAAVMEDAAIEQANRRNELRENNPILLGQELRLSGYQVQPLNWGDPEALAAGLTQRQQQLAVVSQADGATYRNALQPEEADALARSWAGLDGPGRAAILDTFADALTDPNVLRSTLEQFAGTEAHALAVAGTLYDDNRAAAQGIIQGQAILIADPTWAPPPAGDEGWNAQIDAALPTTAFGNNPALEGARQGIADAVRFRYVSLAYASGGDKNVVNPQLLEQAIAEVTGGTVVFNGETIFSPVYGMTEQEFNRLLYPNRSQYNPVRGGVAFTAVAPAAMAGAVTGDDPPIPIGWENVEREGHLEPAGSGQYFIRFGAAGPGATYALDSRTGQAFRLNLGYWMRPEVMRMATAPAEQVRWPTTPPGSGAATPAAAPVAAPVESFAGTPNVGWTPAAPRPQGENAAAVEAAALLDAGRAPGFAAGTPEYERADLYMTQDPPNDFAHLNRYNFAAWQTVLNLSRPEMMQFVATTFNVTTEEVRDRVWPY